MPEPTPPTTEQTPEPELDRSTPLRRLTSPRLGNDIRSYTMVGLPLALLVLLSSTGMFNRLPFATEQDRTILREAVQTVALMAQGQPTATAGGFALVVEPTATREQPTAAAQQPATTEKHAPRAAIRPEDLPINRIRTYTVRQGDSLSIIAQSFNLNTTTLIWSNPNINADLIRIGDELAIPPEDGILYTVAQGDTLGNVASAMNADSDEIIDANGLQEPFTLVPGQRIFVPHGTRNTNRPAAAPAAPVVKQIPVGQKNTVAGVATGKFIWPTAGWISTYHLEVDRPGHRHAGLDIANDYGTPIYAADGGVVVLAEYYGNYGNCVIIDHENGFVTWYGHFTRLNVTRGQRIERGHLLGPMGSTGLSSGPHLHFEMHLNGKMVNPLNYLP